MRRVSITVVCDACEDEVEEETEGDSTMSFTRHGEQWEMDICDECFGGTFLQEARPTNNRRKRKDKTGEFSCDDCDKTFPTQRGLSQHRTRMH
jgi:hypothetical protein